MALGLVYLMGGQLLELEHCLHGMGGSITGMICDGGNQGCVMKGVVAVNTAFTCAHMAMQNTYLDPRHGINSHSPEETMRNMGRIASPGMVETERTIVEIMGEKQVSH
ncbi:MAG: L-serine ammonia-lyase, iron-sulfur-dependent, subunit alpha [Eubacteriales bacterium]|nr:L-serine ammonia-lyase, iron-sulfur-dependent, subunit alpha [Eubacteriales bacterium]